MKTCFVFAHCSSHDLAALRFLPAIAIVLLVGFAGLPWRVAGAVFDDFESYNVGSNLHGQGGWAGWAGDANAGAVLSSNFSFSPIRSVNVNGSNDLVRTFSDATNGQWVFSVMQYIPSASTGTSFVTLLNTYRAPYGAADLNWSVRIQNDVATGQIISELGGGATLPLVTDQWAQIRVEINLAANSVSEFYNGQLLSIHVWQDGTGLNQIEALELFANNAGPVHYDNVTLVPIPTSPPVIPGLVLHLPFENNLTDVTGRGNNGIAVRQTHNTSNTASPSFVAGQLGTALHYASDFGPPTTPGATTTTNTSYVTLGVRPDLQFGSNVNFTVAFWIKLPPDFIGGDLPFFANAAGSLGNQGFVFSPAYGYGNGSGDNPDPAPLNYGGWAVSLYDTGGTNGARVYGDLGSINDGGWHHLSFVFDRKSQVLTYLDGSPARSFNISGTTTAAAKNIDSGLAATVGQDPTGILAETGSGDIDDLGVWRRALTPLEAATLYLAGINNLSFVGVQSYTVNVPPGLSLIANQLDRGSNNAAEVIPYADGNNIQIWNGVSLDSYVMDSATSTGWIDINGADVPLASLPVLSPGSAFFYGNNSGASSITFTGTPHVPVLPVVFTRNTLHYLSRQTNGPGSWDNITGLPPEEGALLLRWTGVFQTNRFTGGQWQPTNPVVNIGEGVVIWLPPVPLTITCPADLITNILGSSVAVNYPNPIVTDGTLLVCTPASGSLFPLGTNLVTCTATNAFGSNTCTFYVTVLQIGLPVISYTNSIPTGYSLIANQLDRGSNTLNEIMPVVPEGSFLFKYDNAVGIYLTASYYHGAWQPGNLHLNPGEGAWLYSPTNFTLILTGLPHVPVLPLPACAGYRLLSRQTNDIGTFDNIIGMTPQPNDAVYIWNGAFFTFYQFDEFALTWSPSDPTIAVGEAVFIQQSAGPGCPGGPNVLSPPPVITTQPLGQTVSPGANVTFSVGASGNPPFIYQWRLNGNNFPGATNASFTLNNVQPADSGAYSVVVANVGGATISQTATLVVITGDLGFVDNFADRIVITTAAGVGSGSNTNATKEAAEPDHADNSGGKSVWLAWQAPASGIATFSTAGSGFDTLLAVYRGTNLAVLKRSASDDDTAGFYASEVRFNAVGGTTYNIAIDGSYGASDHIILNWDLEITTDVIPEIVAQPKDRIVPSGGAFTLLVGAGAGSQLVDYRWFLNDLPIPGATNASLTISNALPADLGLYRVRVSTRPPVVRQVFSRPAVVQMSIVQLGDFANVIARDKFLDSTSLGLDLEFSHNVKDGVVNAAPVGGFTGTQIFNTYGAAKEPGEPNHCGETGGASYWFAYRTPANGRVSVNTSNSTFNTVLAVYSGADPVTSFAALSCVACANVAGFGNEVAEFSTTGGTIYYIVVDGVGGVTGTVKLSYDMITARPVVANQPRNVAVTAGNNGTVSVAIANTSVVPLAYQWQFNSVNLPAATQSSYTRPAFQSSQQGNYRVIVTNQAGAVTSSIAMMYLDAPVRSTNSVVNGSGFFQSQWSGPIGSLLIVQVSTNLINWSSVSTSTVTAGIISYTDNTTAGSTRRYYRTQLAFP